MMRIIFLLLILASNTLAQASTREDIDKALGYIKSISQMTTYSYSYIVKNSYPNQKFDLANGIVYIDLDKKMLSENGTYSTTLLTNQWYYKAIHTEKTVSIIDLKKYYKKHRNAIGLEQFFDSKSMQIPDSVFQKHGKLEIFTVKNDVVTIRFSFVNLMNLNTYELVFDNKNAIPLSLFIKTYSPTNNGVVFQEFKCTNFKKKLPADCFSTARLFDFNSQNIILKSNKNYKPHFEL